MSRDGESKKKEEDKKEKKRKKVSSSQSRTEHCFAAFSRRVRRRVFLQ